MSTSAKYPDCVIPDPMAVEPTTGTGYPEPFRAPCLARVKRRLGDAVGLENFGVNLTILPPGQWSSQRHWHGKQDEFVYILEGEATLVTDAGETVLTAGMAAGFKAGQADGHHLINKSDKPVTYLEIGDRLPGDTADYPDIDLTINDTWPDGRYRFRHKNGEPY
jgi:uncharacterized cupin superfamily protein